MAKTLRTIDDLAGARLLSPSPALGEVAARYAVALTEDVLRLIDRTDPDDPIARQFLPDARELDTRPEELVDPIGDETHSPVKGVVHRYPDRVLLKPILACPVYCRFCFRREFVGPGGDALDEAELAAAIAYIASTPAIWEVIVTGGDPLMLSPRRIRALNDALAAIPHVEVVRWHSRVPIVDPGRVTEELAAALAATGKTVWLAVHCNHARELSAEATGALARLRRAGIALVSQTVLLKGVNDDAETLAGLMRKLVEHGVKPYYLHLPDLAPGTSHFRTSIAEGRAIMQALRGRLSGLAQPTLVLDIPGGYGKVPAGPAYVEDALGAGPVITDPAGNTHPYPG
ncbi:MAG: lysine-2,3-aminomutase-like protein [Bauldia sp.]|nr:lysine-2,3-aminomutase-like protein [Bauldia sp.]